MRSILSIVALMGVLILSGNAFADNNNCDDNDGSCTSGNNSPITHNQNTTNNPVANGGQGGQGGTGGFAAASGGDALSLQGQQQGQVGIVAPTITTATTDVNTNANTNTLGNTGFGNTFSPTSSSTSNGGTHTQTTSQTLTDNDSLNGGTHTQSTAIGGGLGSSTLSPKAEQSQSNVGVNSQDQDQYNKNYNTDLNKNTDIFVSDDDVVYEAPKLPVNSAAATIGGSCNQGVSFQSKDVGASIGSGNPVCDHLGVARGYAAVGDMENAKRSLDSAASFAKFRSFMGYIRGTLTLGLL